MCGIIGYIGNRNAVPILIDGLKKLEYRGYDSAGIVFPTDTGFDVRRCVGKIRELESLVGGENLSSFIGLGHTRWATHGGPTEANAHPHRVRNVVIVHNGIVENYMSLKSRLKKLGYEFSSDTDSEVLSALIAYHCEQNPSLLLEEAVRIAVNEAEGSFAIGVMSDREPGKIVAAKKESPLVVGLGEGEYLLASDIPALLNHTRDVIILHDRQMAVLTADGVSITDFEGNPVEAKVEKITWSPAMAEKGGYRHFMLKEIFEQPRTVMDTIRGRFSLETGGINFEEIGFAKEMLADVRKVFLVACGTSWHAGLVGKYLLESVARIGAETDIASEFRYRDPIIGPGDLFVAITQSGETADTLAAQKEAKRRGAKVLSICNVVGSSSAREADAVIYTHAGPEIGVASTKAFTSQLAALYMLALSMGEARGTFSREQALELLNGLITIPHQMENILHRESEIADMARRYFKASDFLYLARGLNYPVALEGALKLKEISYIHAEGYPAGEMKHGPIALIDEELPVVVLAPGDGSFLKILGNIEEARSRGGQIIAICVDDGAEAGNAETGADSKLGGKAKDVFAIPRSHPLLAPLLFSLPLQLIAYHIAVLRGCDVDQPRNLAKSVTVE
ncbi:MAG: glutamine--fructose-6-phosphate transaminase (isomerizing) [Nitrospirae bacterium]|nr:glutamine--fructose-6-phosphate transaminase (isomerizing) [Nitrospirota bacterium]